MGWEPGLNGCLRGELYSGQRGCRKGSIAISGRGPVAKAIGIIGRIQEAEVPPPKSKCGIFSTYSKVYVPFSGRIRASVNALTLRCTNLYALYEPLRVGSKCSSSSARCFIPPCRICFGVTSSASFRGPLLNADCQRGTEWR